MSMSFLACAMTLICIVVSKPLPLQPQDHVPPTEQGEKTLNASHAKPLLVELKTEKTAGPCLGKLDLALYGSTHSSRNGVYEFVGEMNERPYYKSWSADGIQFMFWMKGHWIVGSDPSVYEGWLVVEDPAKSPERITATWWWVWEGSGWVARSTVHATCAPIPQTCLQYRCPYPLLLNNLKSTDVTESNCCQGNTVVSVDLCPRYSSNCGNTQPRYGARVGDLCSTSCRVYDGAYYCYTSQKTTSDAPWGWCAQSGLFFDQVDIQKGREGYPCSSNDDCYAGKDVYETFNCIQNILDDEHTCKYIHATNEKG